MKLFDSHCHIDVADFDGDDRLDIVFVAGYYAFVNRVADGLGVMLEPHREEPSS